MIHLITYADNKFKNSAIRLYNEAENTNWFNTIEIYEPEKLTHEFKNKYNDILSMKRGGGYWIWKYDIIRQKLNEIQDNDILIYLDAGCTINKGGKKRFDEYINMLNDEQPIISFQMSHREYTYTTKEIFQYFNVLNNDKITKTGQLVNGVLIMKKNKKLISLIDICHKALEYNPLLITDYYNKNPQPKGFKDNRHDQSIFSVVRKMNNPLLIRDETYFIPFGKNKQSLKVPFWVTRKKI